MKKLLTTVLSGKDITKTSQAFKKLVFLLALCIFSLTSLMAQTTYYSYAGVVNDPGKVWNNKFTWTTDDTGATSEGEKVPGNDDKVVILPGVTVTLNANVATTGLDIEIRAGGTLVLGTSEFLAVIKLSGSGTLVIGKSYYPQVTGAHEFVSPGGGTVVFQGFPGLIPTNLTTAANIILRNNALISLGNNLTLHGNLSLENNSRFTIGNSASARSLRIGGNLNISTNARLDVASFNTIHNIELMGNMAANGDVVLSNNTQYATASNGAAIFTFKGATDNELTGSGGQAIFYQLIIDKGSDPTFVLDVQKSISLFAPIGLSNGNSGDPNNPVINKSLWLKNGTLKLGSAVNIPALTSGGNDFFIPLNARLWIDGATVHSTQNPVGSTSNTGFTVIGVLHITSGELKTNNSAGIVYRGTAQILIEGGNVQISQFRPSTAEGIHQASWRQRGGVVTIDGGGETNDTFARFSLPLATHSFEMSGGTLNLSTPDGVNNALGVVIGSSSGNISVTGGTVNITVGNNRNFVVTSTAPFFHLNVYKTGATARDLILDAITHGLGANTAQPLVVNGNLTLHSNARLNANGNNLTLLGNLNIAATAVYVPGVNTTVFSGASAVTRTLTIDNNASTFHHTRFVNANYTFAGTINPLRVTGDLEQTGAGSILNMGGKNLEVSGNITLGNHSSNPVRWNNAPRLTLTGGSAASQLRIRGWYGNGPVRIVLNKALGASILEHTDLGETILELQAGVFYIGSNLLSTNKPIAGAPFSNTKMIRTNGLAGDEGYRLQITHNGGSNDIIFPVGVASKYTQLRMNVNGANTITAVNGYYYTVVPVNTHHPLVESGEKDKVLQFYWMTDAEILNPVTGLVFSNYFTYIPADIQGATINYRNWYLRFINNEPQSWANFNNFSTNPPPTMYFGPGGIGFISAHFTAGGNNTFQAAGAAAVFYSKNSGNWNDPNTWTASSTHSGGNYPGNSTPNNQSMVVIAPQHTITVPSNIKAEALSVRLRSNGTQRAILDLQTTAGDEFGSIVGDGILRLSSEFLPRNPNNPGDPFSSLSIFQPIDGGIIEYYGTNNYTLTNSFTQYYNVWFSGTGIKTLPANVNFHGQVILRNKAFVRTNNTTAGSVNFNGEVIFNETSTAEADQNIFQLSAGASSTVNFPGVLDLRESGTLRVENSATARLHNIYLSGEITSAAGRVTLSDAGNVKANLWLQGSSNMNLGSGATGGTWRFHRLIIDKTVLANQVVVGRKIELTGATDGTEKALEIRRGSLHLQGNNGTDITLSSGGADFAIPSLSSLNVEGNNIVRTTGTTGINLEGELKFRGQAQGFFTGTANTLRYGVSGTAALEMHDQASVQFSGQIIQQTNGKLNLLLTGQSRLIVGTQAPSVAGKPVLEILTDGAFRLISPATLTIAHGQGASTAALRLEASTYEVTGTIILGHTTTSAGQQMGIMSSVPLNQIQVRGTNSPEAFILTHNLTLTQPVTSLDIGTGTFSTRGRQLNLAGRIINNGTFTGSTNDLVTFTESQLLQSITGTGTTNFHNLTLQSSNGVGLQKNITVAGTLDIAGGFLNDQGNTIWSGGNVNFTGNHVSPAGTGGLVLNGTINQDLSGSGSIGRLTINKAAGQARATSNITLSQNLRLENGIFNIQSHLLTLNQNVRIEPIGTGFSSGKMILTSGSATGNQGIRKIFSAADQSGEFTFPLGVASKYTPLLISNMNIPEGRSITMYPVNQVHPNIAAQGVPSQVLQYYWVVNSDLGTQTMSADMAFRYIPTDVGGTLNNNYFTAQLRNLLTPPIWLKLYGFVDPMLIDAGNNLIKFQPRNDNEAFIDGDYTAGISTAIPTNVEVFATKRNTTGNWHDPALWVGGAIPVEGAAALIDEGAVVTINQDRVRVYQTQITGHLKINPSTTLHNLGIIAGNGTVEVEGIGDGQVINFPGRFSEFAARDGSTIILGGLGGLLPTNILTYNNLIVRGSGTKTLPAFFITITGNLNVQAGTFRLQHDLELRGDLTLSSGASFQVSLRLVRFKGNRHQLISGAFTGANRFYNFEIDNSQGITLNSNVDVNRYLFLRNGIIYVSEGFSLILSYHGGHYEWRNTDIKNRNSYISGKLTRALAIQTGVFNTPEKWLFPVGKGNLRRMVDISNLTQAGNWTVEYFPENPRKIVEFNPPSSVANVLEAVSQYEYWVVLPPGSGLSLDLELQYSAYSNLNDGLSSFAQNITLAYLQNPVWRSMFGGIEAIVSTNRIRFNGVQFPTTKSTEVIMTFGAKSLLSSPLPIELLFFTGKIMDGRSRLEWVTASETNNDFFTLERSADGNQWQVLGTVNSKAENGFSTHSIHYIYFDENPLDGISYYRLKQTDFDGAFTYSQPIALQWNSAALVNFLLFPNPSSGRSFTVSATGLQPWDKTIVAITDMNGRLLWEEPLEASPEGFVHSTIQAGVALPKGLYLVSLTTSSSRNVVRMAVR